MSVAQTDRNFQDYNDLLSLRKELSEKTGKSVDVVIEKFANPIILYRASKESIRVEWVQKRLDPLKETFIKIIREGLANKSFDEGEFEAAKNAGFYKFIDFNIF